MARQGSVASVAARWQIAQSAKCRPSQVAASGWSISGVCFGAQALFANPLIRPPMRHSITLNVRYDQPHADWDRVMRVYESMPGWRATGHDQSWFGAEGEPIWVWASVEPSGIQFEAEMDEASWSKWLSDLCTRLSSALGRPVQDATL